MEHKFLKITVVALICTLLLVSVGIFFFWKSTANTPSATLVDPEPIVDPTIDRETPSPVEDEEDVDIIVATTSTFNMLTPEQRVAVTKNATPVYDEGAYIVATTSIYWIWFTGMDDHFVIELKDFKPTMAHRAEAEQKIVDLLGINNNQLVEYDVRVVVAGSPFEYSPELTLPYNEIQ